MEHLPREARRPGNRDVPQFLERRARPSDPATAAFDLDEYQLHAHPDLAERLAEAGAGLDASLVAAYGVPVLLHPGGVIFAVGYGSDTVLYRLPAGLRARVAPSRWAYDVGDVWVAADAWLSDVPREEGTGRVREWCRLAHEHAGQGDRDQE